MNPDRIYRQYRDEALAKQVTADEYSIFVAMPFGERYSYRSGEVFDNVICAAARRATEMGKACHPFAVPTRVDKMAGVAANITENRDPPNARHRGPPGRGRFPTRARPRAIVLLKDRTPSRRHKLDRRQSQGSTCEPLALRERARVNPFSSASAPGSPRNGSSTKAGR